MSKAFVPILCVSVVWVRAKKIFANSAASAKISIDALIDHLVDRVATRSSLADLRQTTLASLARARSHHSIRPFGPWPRRRTSTVWRRALAWEKTDEEGLFEAQVPKLWKHQQGHPVEDEAAYLLRFERLVPDDVLEKARQLVPQLQFNLDPDSVDGHPSFEIPWVHQGIYTHNKLAEIFSDVVESRIIPKIQNSRLVPQGSSLFLCDALLRLYEDGQRRIHPVHYDVHALVTVVFELESSDQGGFYVQPGAHAESRLSIVMNPGDVYAHSYNVMHGVDVVAGRRCSIILWFTDSANSCINSLRPWYETPRVASQPESQYNIGETLVATGHLERGMAFLESAALQGHFMAQNKLGMLMLEGTVDSAPNLSEAERWFAMSSAQGSQFGMMGMAMVCEDREQGNASLSWMKRAAEQRADPDAFYYLGLRLVEDSLSNRHLDAAEGFRCIWQAAEMGHPEAQDALSNAY